MHSTRDLSLLISKMNRSSGTVTYQNSLELSLLMPNNAQARRSLQKDREVKPIVKQHLLFIADDVEDYQVLLTGLEPGIPVHILPRGQDGVRQITDVIARAELRSQTSLSIHIVSHGNPGELYLGNSQLSLSTLGHYTNDVKAWFSPEVFRPGQSKNCALYLYGCRVAATEAGQQFLRRLQCLTGATIYASTTKVGNTDQGGTWDLDVTFPSPVQTLHATSPPPSRALHATPLPSSPVRVLRATPLRPYSLPALTMNANAIFSANALANFPGTLAADGGGFEAMPASPKVANAELVVIDAGVADKATLMADFESRGIEYIVLDGNADGVQQISEALAGRSDLDALHIISHGSEGQAHLGNGVLSEETLDEYSDALGDWGEALGVDGDILFYGCNLAEGPGGTSFINEISALTGADVAASDDLTGAAQLGGDWDLEARVGEIETSTIEVLDFAQVLDAAFTVTSSSGTSASGNVNTGGATGTFTLTRTGASGLNGTVNFTGGGDGIEVRNNDIGTVAPPSNPNSFAYDFSVTPNAGSAVESITITRQQYSPGGNAEPSDFVLTWSGGGLATLNDPQGRFTTLSNGATFASGTTLRFGTLGGGSVSNNTSQWSIEIPSSSVSVSVTSIQDASGNADFANEWLAFNTTLATNTAPVNTVPGNQTVTEGTPAAISGISVTDPEGNLATTQLTVTNGTLNVTLSGAATISAGANSSADLTISGSEADINATLATLTYQGTAAGSDTLTVLSTDSGGTPLTDTDTVAIAIAAAGPSPGGVSAGIRLWVKGDAGTGTTTDGAAINTWSDQSGNSNDVAVTAAGREPTYSTGDASSNYNPTVVFDGLNDGLELAPFMTGAEAGGSVFGAAANNTPGTGFDNLVVFGIDNPHLGTNSGSGGAPLVWMNGSSPINATHPTLPQAGQTHVWSWEWDTASEPSNTSSNTGVDIIFDGEVFNAPDLEIRESQFANGAPAANQFQIGSYESVEVWDGPIGEIIVYDRNLTAAESQRVNSYISLKWGTTLDNDPASSTVNYDYVDSNGSVIWAGTSNAAYQAYHNDIAGIGRDDASTLDQQRSNSVNSDSVVTIDNGGAFAADNSFLVWGNNDQAATYGTNYTPGSFTPAAGYFRMDRVWTVQETGTVGTVTVENAEADHLLVSNDPTFATGVTEIALSGGSATVDFTDGQFFTFGKELTAPGGVSAGLQFWTKADAGTSSTTDGTAISQWNDQTLNAFDLTQVTASQQPLYREGTAATNFNPGLQFNDDFLNNTSRIVETTDGLSMFSIASTEVTGGIRTVIGMGDNYNDPTFDLEATWISPFLDGSGNVDLFNNQLPLNQPMLWHARGANEGTNTSANSLRFGFQGEEVATSLEIVSSNAFYGQNVGVGSDGGGEDWQGLINETVIYNRELTSAETQKVNSYLALKYGITQRAVDNDAAIVEGDYVSSGDTKVWDYAANSAYHNDVAGIGRDDASALDQQKSNSVNDDSMVTIDNGVAFAANNSFLVWGNNDGSTSFETSYNPTFATVEPYFLMGRTWKVQETGTVGTVEISGPAGAEHLFVDDDGDFTNGGTTEIALTDGSTTVDLTNGQFFTFGREVSTDVVWGIRNNNELGYLNPNDDYTWTARRTLSTTTNAFGLVNSTTGIAIQNDDDIVLIDLDTGLETVLTEDPLSPAFSDLGTYAQGTYDATNNLFYVTEEGFDRFQIFSVDPVANTFTFVEERRVGTGGSFRTSNTDDWVLIGNKLYGVDNNSPDLVIIDLDAPENDNMTELDLPEIASTTGNNEASGVWQGDNGLIHVVDDNGTVFELDPDTNSFVQILQDPTPNGDIWSSNSDDFAGLAPIPRFRLMRFGVCATEQNWAILPQVQTISGQRFPPFQ